MKLQHLLVPALALLAAACAEHSPTTVGEPAPQQPGRMTFAYRCSASTQSGLVQCSDQPSLPPGVSADLIVGGGYVTLTSSNVAYNSGTGYFTFDVTVRNNMGQPIGTTDGSTADANGIRVFFHSGPTVTAGTGTISVLADGTGTFTASNQPYYQYTTVLDSAEVSAAKTWTLVMPPTVQNFSFLLYVSAPVQYPQGWIDVTLNPTSVSPGGSPSTATAVVRAAVGTVITTGTVSWSSANTTNATVSPIDARTASVYGQQGFAFVRIDASHTESGITRTGSAWLGVF
ncbi:MAG TPA: hypothetical protein VFT45_26410 [Longimicrobium sp.]|nr:hypothetical protein [Longimicrobium sp.]